jgi:hypothetical protein
MVRSMAAFILPLVEVHGLSSSCITGAWIR